MRLTRFARVYWTSVDRDCARNRILIETCDEMKDKLKEKYFSKSYRHSLLDELHRLHKESMSVQAYTTTFDDLTLCCELQEDPPIKPYLGFVLC